jgi:hypothetical protein
LPERTATSSGTTSVPAVTGAAPAAAIETASGAAALTGVTSSTSAASGPTARTGDDQRRIIGADHEGATAPATASHTRAAHDDLQNFARGQVEAAADLGTSPTRHTSCITTLRAKGDDLIGAVDRHREGDEATGIREFEPLGVGGWFRYGER